MGIEENGIISLDHKSCASITVQCLVDAGVTDWCTAFNTQINHAKKLGQMPDDIKVMRETLKAFGFVMQSTQVENIRVQELLNKLGRLGKPALVFIQVVDYKHLGGNMIALGTDGFKYILISPTSQKVDAIARFWTAHVWIRWDDGVDRSPYPRRAVRRKNSVASHRRSYEETECYKPFQPNPCNNYIGDCVVRAISGAMDVSWSDAIDLLSSANETTVNAREVYPKILKQNGFVHHKPIIRGGHHLDGKSFCNEMHKIYHNGERIFAHVGRLHVAAIVPVHCSDGDITYKIIDSWDSSKRTIGDYWVKSVKAPDNDLPMKKPARKSFNIGTQLLHPSFGIGTVTSIAPGILTVDFKANGLRRLGEIWAREHCFCEHFNITEDRMNQ